MKGKRFSQEKIIGILKEAGSIMASPLLWITPYIVLLIFPSVFKDTAINIYPRFPVLGYDFKMKSSINFDNQKV